MIVVLIGYMGSGKSSVGKALSEIIRCDFIDLDDYIEKTEQASISEIFKTKGEIYFRKIETKYLKELINKKERIVLSVGGGTPCYSDNMKFLNNAQQAISIYLKSSISNLVQRLNNEKSKRPLISHLDSKESLAEFIGKHLFERSQYYNQSNKTVVVDEKSIKEIVEEVVVDLF